jgi:riboflavin kinase/FMN adenylyltransferase
MQVFRGVPERATTSTVLTIGNFDGVHLGHRALLAELAAKARELGLPATVLTFEPHPRELFAPDQAPARLASLRDKFELLAECGVDRVHVCRFNRQLASLTAAEFIDRILVRGLAVRHLIIGDDFRFGKGARRRFRPAAASGEATRLCGRGHAYRRFRRPAGFQFGSARRARRRRHRACRTAFGRAPSSSPDG